MYILDDSCLYAAGGCAVKQGKGNGRTWGGGGGGGGGEDFGREWGGGAVWGEGLGAREIGAL